MNVTLRTPKMTREHFLDWAERQEAPFEFDGFEPVPMTGGNRKHSLLCGNLYFALRKRLDGSDYEVLSEAGVATVGNAVRYPDVLITRTKGPQTDKLIPGVLVVFEVLSPTSGRVDRNTKLREYRAVPSIRRYVILDHVGPDLTVYSRPEGAQEWTADALTADDVLELPEVGIELPVNELYRGIEFPGDASGA